MSTNGLLTEKEQELVAVGASIAAGCRPCTAYHVRAAPHRWG
jgi:AhpD family alkylhydroperoxidase